MAKKKFAIPAQEISEKFGTIAVLLHADREKIN